MSIYTKLKAELALNPTLYGSMSDQEVVDELNAVDKERDRKSMSGNEVLNQIDPTALATLSGDNAVKVMNIIGMESVDPFGPAAQIFKDAFGNTSATIQNLAAARTHYVSRASEIGLTIVAVGEVKDARTQL